jgi:hypothetical protein
MIQRLVAEAKAKIASIWSAVRTGGGEITS